MNAYQRALAVNPLHPDALNNMGNAMKGVADFTAAETFYRKAISVRPNFGGAHSNLGNLLREKNDITGALHHYQLVS